MLFFFFFSDNPDRPSEMISNQTMDENENCILHLSWGYLNSSTEDLSLYMVYLNGTNVVNETHIVNSPWQLFAYPVCCGNHIISIRAVNKGNCASPGTPDQMIAPRSLSSAKCDTEQTTSQSANINNQNQDVCKLLYVTYFMYVFN